MDNWRANLNAAEKIIEELKQSVPTESYKILRRTLIDSAAKRINGCPVCLEKESLGNGFYLTSYQVNFERHWYLFCRPTECIDYENWSEERVYFCPKCGRALNED